MTEQAIHFNSIAPNINVKMPATQAGIKAMEEAYCCGSQHQRDSQFSPLLSACCAWPKRWREAWTEELLPGEDISTMSPICTIMVGRLDDWVKVSGRRPGIISDPEYSTGQRRRRIQESLFHFQREELQSASPFCRIPQSPSLVTADRRRSIHDDPVRMAGEVQQL